MKKILIATTALVATAGMAAAEFTTGGDGRLGLRYTEDAVNETELEQRMRITFTGIAETDAGVKFEGRIRIESNSAADNSIAGSGPGSAGLAVSAGGLRVDVGNVSNVIDSGDVVNNGGYGVGLTSIVEMNNTRSGNVFTTGFGNDNQDFSAIKLRYTAGDLTAAASYTNDKVNDTDNFQVGVGYAFRDYSVGVAFGSGDMSGADVDYWVATVDGSVGAVDFAVQVADADGAGDDVSYGVSLDYDVSAATSIRFAVAGGGADGLDTAVGLGVVHDLGGGVSLLGGVGKNTAGNTVADLGVSFSF